MQGDPSGTGRPCVAHMLGEPPSTPLGPVREDPHLARQAGADGQRLPVGRREVGGGVASECRWG
eukprot:13089189-Alexandrium_andersonii.AAC.1